jgi:hypothetical protein
MSRLCPLLGLDLRPIGPCLGLPRLHPGLPIGLRPPLPRVRLLLLASAFCARLVITLGGSSMALNIACPSKV